MAVGSPTLATQTPEATERSDTYQPLDNQPAFKRRLEAGSYWSDSDLSATSSLAESAPLVQMDGRAERLASWTITFLAALVVSLSVIGGAWALGLVG